VKNYNKIARQAGMTLIELTVVLLVLIGLAGLLIPYVSGFVGKTHDSTGSSNIQALNNAMIRFSVENYDAYPDKMDSLIQEDDAVYSKMMSQMYLEPHTLLANEATSLKGAGINNLMVMDETTDNATFGNTTGTPLAVTTGKVVAILKGTVLTNLANIMGKPVDTVHNHYVAVGVGDESTIAGKTVADVPVHFAGRADMAANVKYNHFIAVFETPKADFCDLTAFNALNDLGSNAIIESTDAPVAVQVDADAATALAAAGTSVAIDAGKLACSNLNGVDTAGDADGEIWTTAGYTWVDGGSDAKFVGTAMAMMMNNFEGMGGALSNYYNKVN